MKISTKGRYAIEIMLDLAQHSDTEHLESLRNVAARRILSEKYLERIIKALKDAGLVHSVRGAYGGYCLAKKTSAINITEILNAVEGELAPVHCLVEDQECGMDCNKCATRSNWNLMWKEILHVTNSVTVQDVLDNLKERK